MKSNNSDSTSGKFSGNQVLTETDAMRAVLDYMALQLEGRFLVEFPYHSDVLRTMVETLRDPIVRISDRSMLYVIMNSVSDFGTGLTVCMVTGCDQEGNHSFMREYINLVWDARQRTGEWLKGQGIVPGQSTN